MRSLLVLLLASSIFFPGCGSTPHDPMGPPPFDGPGERAEIDPATLFPAPLRLPDTLTPRSYTIDLRIDPSAPTFTGTVTIDVELAAPTRVVRLHADGLTIDHAEARYLGVTRALDARLDDTALALVSPTELPAGSVTLALSWSGPLPESPVGIYRVQDGGRWFVFTQFEPLEARRAFPCFDEPRWKTPFTLSIETPTGLRAFSNNPESSAPSTTAGWTRWSFTPTVPLPTYLVAFAVGDLEAVEGARVSGGKVPFRVIAPAGKGHLASFVLDKAPRYLDVLESWFGTPYPFPKLDLVAVPSFSSSGMENAGLITFREALILMDGDRAPIDDRIWCEAVVAHELAHMWFGDLVTMAWWDELWLNEGFATWMARKVLAVVSPELDADDGAMRSKLGVMLVDARVNARAVRQPITKEGDIYNAFDGITYGKGAAVLRMIEGWVGPEKFQAGVRAYLAEHAHGNATTADLLAALGRASGRDVAGLVAGYLDQVGVPYVDLTWRCEADGVVALDVSQTPYRMMGDPRPELDTRWQVPVCARLSDGRKSFDHCAVLAEPRATWRVNAGFCPTFAHPNIDEAGYYRWQTSLGPVSLARVDRSAFAGWVASLRSGVESGRAPLASLVDGVEPLFQTWVTPNQLDDLLGAVGSVPRFDPDAAESPRYKKKVKALLQRIPLDLTLGDTVSERRRQPSLVRWLAAVDDPRVATYAKKIALGFLDALDGRGKGTTSIEDVSVYLPLHVSMLGRAPAGKSAREALWKRLRAAFDEVRNPSEREIVIESLASFRDADLVLRSYDLLLDGTLRAQDLRTLRAHTPQLPETVRALWQWLTGHFDAVVAKLGAKSAPTLPGFAGSFCTEDDARAVEAFFASKKDALPDGIERPLAQTLEGIRACVVGRERYGKEARAWYAK